MSDLPYTSVANRAAQLGHRFVDDPSSPHNFAADRARRFEDFIVSRQQAPEVVGLSVATVDKLIRNGDFAPVVQLSPRRIGFKYSDLMKWVESRLERGRAA